MQIALDWRYGLGAMLIYCGLAGCSYHINQVPDSPVDTPPINEPLGEMGLSSETLTQLPSFPEENPGSPRPDHRVSDAEYVLDGINTRARYGTSIREEDTALVIIPASEGKVAWASYATPTFNPGKAVTLTVDAVSTTLLPEGGDPLPLNYWLGVADFTTHQWDWLGEFDASADVTLNTAAMRDRYMSAQGFIHFVIVVADGAEEGLPGVKINTSIVYLSTTYIPNNPHYIPGLSLVLGNGKGVSALDPDEQYVTITWDHVGPLDPSDEVNVAETYEVYRAASGDATRLNIGSIAAPDTMYVDPTDNKPEIDETIPGETYQYWVRAETSEEGYTPFGSSMTVQIPFGDPGDQLAQDTLYAIPLTTATIVGEPVTIEVMVGETANPFAAMNMVSVTVKSGAEYVKGSFNPGSIGGSNYDVDGLWETIGATNMFGLPDMFVVDEDLGGGWERWEFSLSSLWMSDYDGATGSLFNFQFTFDTPGTYVLGFQEWTDDVGRTYYSDLLGAEYTWSDTTNVHPGFANAIVVSE